MDQHNDLMSLQKTDRENRRGFLTKACGVVAGATGALMAHLIAARRAEAAHGHDNFSSGGAVTVHAENTGNGVAVLGTNTSGFFGGAGVRGERSGGTGDGVQGIRSGSGTSGNGVYGEHNGNASGHAVSAWRRGTGRGNAVNAVNETTSLESHGVFASRSGSGNGHGATVERTGSGFGYGLLCINETTAEKSSGAFVRRTSDIGSGDGLIAAREGAATGDGIRGERAGTGAGAGVHAIGPVALHVEGQSVFSTVGSGLILAGTNSATILNANVTADSHISVTLTSNPGSTAVIARVSRVAGISFTVHVSVNVVNNTGFTFFIVEPV